MGTTLEEVIAGTESPWWALVAADIADETGLRSLADELRTGFQFDLCELPYGNGYGYGYGNGNGNGYGYGYGDGYGNGYGNGNGNGNGDGYGNGNGDGYGYGNGNGNGNGGIDSRQW